MMMVEQSLVMAFLSCYQVAILRLQSLIVPFTSAVRAPIAGINPEAIQARQRFARRCYKLLSNAMRWRRYAKAFILPAGGEGYGLGAGGSWETCLARELVEKVLLPVLEAGWETGGSVIASQVRRQLALCHRHSPAHVTLLAL
jgi:GC-rich sequence DNA-binding factor